MSNIVKKSDLKSVLESPQVKDRIKEILGRNAATFATSVIQIASQNEMLANAEPTSIVNAAMTATTLNLPLNNALGQSYLVPFNEKQKDGTWKVKAQFILGYKGLKQLAIRSAQYRHIYAKAVYKGQKIEDESFLGYKFDWKAKESEEVIGYASYYQLLNGFESLLYMSNDEIMAHGKKFSQTFKKGFGKWVDDYEKMALKTVTKLHLNSGEAPLSIEMQTAIRADQGIINDIEAEDVTYPDNDAPEHDHELERLRNFIESAETLDELDEAKLAVNASGKGEDLLPLIKEKTKEINKKSK